MYPRSNLLPLCMCPCGPGEPWASHPNGDEISKALQKHIYYLADGQPGRLETKAVLLPWPAKQDPTLLKCKQRSLTLLSALNLYNITLLCFKLSWIIRQKWKGIRSYWELMFQKLPLPLRNQKDEFLDCVCEKTMRIFSETLIGGGQSSVNLCRSAFFFSLKISMSK